VLLEGNLTRRLQGDDRPLEVPALVQAEGRLDEREVARLRRRGCIRLGHPVATYAHPRRE
jgi:hypothetical protein